MKPFCRHSALFKDANQKPDTGTSSAYPPNHLEECPGISVEFHVIIHEEWQFDPGKDRVCIRFGINRLGNWKVDYAQMEPAKFDEFSICEGSFGLDSYLSFPGILKQQNI